MFHHTLRQVERQHSHSSLTHTEQLARAISRQLPYSVTVRRLNIPGITGFSCLLGAGAILNRPVQIQRQDLRYFILGLKCDVAAGMLLENGKRFLAFGFRSGEQFIIGESPCYLAPGEEIIEAGIALNRPGNAFIMLGVTPFLYMTIEVPVAV